MPNRSKLKQTQANEADRDNVSVSESVNEIENENENETDNVIVSDSHSAREKGSDSACGGIAIYIQKNRFSSCIFSVAIV